MKAGALVLFVLVLLGAESTRPALAAERKLGHFGNWDAFLDTGGGQRVCYMVLQRHGSAHAGGRASYLMVTHRPVEASSDVFSYDAGLELRARRSVRLSAGLAHFDLFSAHDAAWARDGLTDHAIAKALLQNATAHVAAQPARSRARPLLDSFDLAGARDAYQAIGEACGLIRKAPRRPPAKQRKLPKS